MDDTAAKLEQPKTRALGKTGIQVSALGVSTNKWSHGSNDEAVFQAYQAFQDGGISFSDTAEVYGFGKSEPLVGDCLQRDGQPAVIATRFAPFIACSSPRHLLKALDASLARLGIETIDLYYIHFPYPIADLDALADAMAEAVTAGKVCHVGVSNFNAKQMRYLADRLSSSNIPLAANEVQYSLLARKPEANGVLDACRELGASLIAYFPLARGRLTKPSAEDKNGHLKALRKIVAEIAKAHQASPSQVELNWLLARDPYIIPIPGASKAINAKQNIAPLNWRLTDDIFAAIDAASASWR